MFDFFTLTERIAADAVEEERVTFECPSQYTTFVKRTWYAGLVTDSKPANDDTIIFTQQPSGPVMSNAVSGEFSLDLKTFELTIRNDVFGEYTYTCITKSAEGEQERVDPIKITVYGKNVLLTCCVQRFTWGNLLKIKIG